MGKARSRRRERAAVRELLAAERRALADDLDELTEQQLASQSLCGAWKVREVAAHVLAPLVYGRAGIARQTVVARFDLNQMNERLAAEVARWSIGQIAALLRERSDELYTLGAIPPYIWLNDVVVHGEDIRRPLGLAHQVAPEALRLGLDGALSVVGQAALPWLTRGRRGIARAAAQGRLRLRATDLDWSFGSGALVSGTGIDLLLAITGRSAGAERLSGPGVAHLAPRTTAS